MTAWLNVIGVSEAGPEELPSTLRYLLVDAKAVLAPARFLEGLNDMRGSGHITEQVSRQSFDAVARALLEDEDEKSGSNWQHSQDLIEWQPPLEEMLKQVVEFRGKPTVIIATGDPMWYGIGATLARHLSLDEFVVHPRPSAFQLAAAKLHWPLQNVATLSLHGRPVQHLHPHILPGARILALTTDGNTADLVIELLVDRGYGQSRLTILQDLGGPLEHVFANTAEELNTGAIGDFYVLGIDCVATPGAPLLPPLPGLPDTAFFSDGQLTKREVRAATVAKLAPYPGALLWDVGAGSGSIGIEWMRSARGAHAIAFEKSEQRVAMIGANAKALGTPTLQIEAGEAIDHVIDAPAPDAVFIGGGVDDETLFQACWQALKPEGRLVVNAVTLEGELALYKRHEHWGGELTRTEISVLDSIGDHRVMRPRMALTQWMIVKP